MATAIGTGSHIEYLSLTLAKGYDGNEDKKASGLRKSFDYESRKITNFKSKSIREITNNKNKEIPIPSSLRLNKIIQYDQHIRALHASASCDSRVAGIANGVDESKIKEIQLHNLDIKLIAEHIQIGPGI